MSDAKDNGQDNDCNCHRCQEHRRRLESPNYYLTTPDVFARVKELLEVKK